MFKLVNISEAQLSLLQEKLELPSDRSDEEPVEVGEWVTVSDGKIARITGSDVVASHNTFPILRLNEFPIESTVTIFKGACSFETDRYDKSATICAGTLLTVKGDGNTPPARGILAPAKPGDPIRAICEGKDCEKNTIRGRILDGGATAFCVSSKGRTRELDA